MSQILFNRTVKTNIIIYPNDGTGRDCYIYFNNGGFWKDNIKRYALQEKFKRSSFARFRSIRKTPPIWNYHADGSGRDSYILYDYGGLINNYKVPRMHNFRGYDENLNDNYLRKTYLDIWSFGCIVFEMAGGIKPFYTKEPGKIALRLNYI